MANYIGQQLGKSRLTQLLGTGGFAEVCLGEHLHLGTQAAIKLLPSQLVTQEEVRVLGHCSWGVNAFSERGANRAGQPVTSTGTTNNGVGYTLTYIVTCSGTYKGGMLTYTETATSYQIAFANGLNCRANVPFVYQNLTGTFTDAHTVSGAYKSDAIIITCSDGQSIQQNPQNGTWAGAQYGVP